MTRTISSSRAVAPRQSSTSFAIRAGLPISCIRFQWEARTCLTNANSRRTALWRCGRFGPRREELKNSRTQELKNSRTQELKNSRTQELKNSRTQELENSRTRELAGPRVWRGRCAPRVQRRASIEREQAHKKGGISIKGWKRPRRHTMPDARERVPTAPHAGSLAPSTSPAPYPGGLQSCALPGCEGDMVLGPFKMKEAKQTVSELSSPKSSGIFRRSR